MVCNCGYNAAGGGQAVARQVDAALVRRVVERVDVVPGGGVGEARYVADAVGEESGGGGVLRVQEMSEESVGWVGLGDVGEGQGNGRAVAEGAPG